MKFKKIKTIIDKDQTANLDRIFNEGISLQKKVKILKVEFNDKKESGVR